MSTHEKQLKEGNVYLLTEITKKKQILNDMLSVSILYRDLSVNEIKNQIAECETEIEKISKLLKF